MSNTRDIIPEHLRGIVTGSRSRGQWTCIHEKPFSECIECIDEAEKEYRKLDNKKREAGR